MFQRTARSTVRALSSSRYASTLVIAEHSGGAISQGTLATVTAALKLGSETSVLVAGGDADAATAAAAITGVTKVLTLDCNTAVAEDLAASLVGVVAGGAFSHVLAPCSNVGKNYIPRLAALCDSAPLTDIQEVVSEDTFKRPMYAGNAIATVTMSDAVKFLLVRTTAFEKAAETGGSALVESAGSPAQDAGHSSFMSASVAASDRPDLGSARVVISGGRGLKNGENFAMLETLADKLGGAVGASRAAVDAGFVPNEYQVGQTGKVVAPDLYMAVGISGAIQHLSGMKDSKTIVAVNKDPEAPIFQVADYGLVADLFKVVPEMNEKM